MNEFTQWSFINNTQVELCEYQLSTRTVLITQTKPITKQKYVLGMRNGKIPSSVTQLQIICVGTIQRVIR